jgi:hypothetical protein
LSDSALSLSLSLSLLRSRWRLACMPLRCAGHSARTLTLTPTLTLARAHAPGSPLASTASTSESVLPRIESNACAPDTCVSVGCGWPNPPLEPTWRVSGCRPSGRWLGLTDTLAAQGRDCFTTSKPFCGACTASEHPAPPPVHLGYTLHRYHTPVHAWRRCGAHLEEARVHGGGVGPTHALLCEPSRGEVGIRHDVLPLGHLGAAEGQHQHPPLCAPPHRHLPTHTHASPTPYSDEKVANREIRVRLLVIKNGY